MTETSKKKKLLDDNKDIYISEHDKNLSYEALNQIVDAKRRYAQAAKDGDKEEMTRSNNVANAVRAKYGNYTAGNSGDEYNPFVYENTSYKDYSSKYEDELDELYDSIINGVKPFEYDYRDDPAYQAYKAVYDKQGELAYDRALAENSLRTGGVENTNAQSAAMQALGYYNSQLAAKIPELYEAAFQRHYKDEQSRLDNLINAYDMTSAREERDYSRHLDSLADSKDIRDFIYRRDQDLLDRNYRTESDDWERNYRAESDNWERNYRTESDDWERNYRTESDNWERNYRTESDNWERNYRTESDDWERNYRIDSDEKDRQKDLTISENDVKMKGIDFLYNLLRDSIDDEKWRANYNLNAFQDGYTPYKGNIGTSGVLGYARTLFGNPKLTMSDLYALLGL